MKKTFAIAAIFLSAVASAQQPRQADADENLTRIKILVAQRNEANDHVVMLAAALEIARAALEKARKDATGSHELRSAVAGDYALWITNNNATATNQYGLRIGLTGDPNDATRNFLTAIGNTTERATIRSNGGIANYQANNVNLSDEASKGNLIPAPDYRNAVRSLHFTRGRYLDGDRDLIFVTAQEAGRADPELVTRFSDKYLGVYEQQLQMRINSVIPRLLNDMDEYESRLRALEARLQ